MASLERSTRGSRHGCATVSREFFLIVLPPVFSGVPQGTVLVPLMFLLYVNGISNKVSQQTSIKVFADDCLLYRTINSDADERQLQQDLDTIEWSNT